MKNKTTALLSILAIALLAGCSPPETVDHDQLNFRDGIPYKINSEIPFSGTVVEKHPNGQKYTEATYKDGKPDGISIWWYPDGKKEFEGNYKDGKRDGARTEWYANGQKRLEATYKDGAPEGIHLLWDEDGKKIFERTYKDGELIKEEKFDQ